MKTDVRIKKIINVRFAKHHNWHRTESSPRIYDALVLLIDGKIDYIFEKTTVSAKAGDLLLLPGTLPYRGVRHTDRVSFFVLDFQCEKPLELQQFGAPCILMRNTSPDISAQFATITELWQKQPIETALRTKAFLYTMLCHAFDEQSPQKTVTATEKILDYIQVHVGDESLSVSDLCKTFYISESQLRRNVIRATGLRPNDYILSIRLNRAKNALLDTDQSIKEIAAACGFANQYYFSSCFSQKFGLSPREFRKSGR